MRFSPGPGLALVIDRFLPTTEPRNKPPGVGILFLQFQKPVADLAVEQPEVTCVHGQVDFRSRIDCPLGHPRKKHLEGIFPIAFGAHRIDHICTRLPFGD